MIETLRRRTFLLTELNIFDKSTKRTASQVSLLYITCIACMIKSLPASFPAYDVIMSVRMCVTTTFPAIRRNTSPIPFARSRDFSQV